MPRPKILIDKVLLEKIIVDLESVTTYINRSALYTDVVKELVAKHGYATFSGSVIYNKVKEYNLTPKTKNAKRGEALKGGNVEALKKWKESGGDSKSRKVGDCSKLIDYYTNEETAKFVDGSKVVPKGTHPLKLAKSIKRGSLRAAIKLMCLYCTHYNKGEIKNCECYACPLHPLRPYRNSDMDVDDTSV